MSKDALEDPSMKTAVDLDSYADAATYDEFCAADKARSKIHLDQLRAGVDDLIDEYLQVDGPDAGRVAAERRRLLLAVERLKAAQPFFAWGLELGWGEQFLHIVRAWTQQLKRPRDVAKTEFFAGATSGDVSIQVASTSRFSKGDVIVLGFGVGNPNVSVVKEVQTPNVLLLEQGCPKDFKTGQFVARMEDVLQSTWDTWVGALLSESLLTPAHGHWRLSPADVYALMEGSITRSTAAELAEMLYNVGIDTRLDLARTAALRPDRIVLAFEMAEDLLEARRPDPGALISSILKIYPAFAKNLSCPATGSLI